MSEGVAPSPAAQTDVGSALSHARCALVAIERKIAALEAAPHYIGHEVWRSLPSGRQYLYVTLRNDPDTPKGTKNRLYVGPDRKQIKHARALLARGRALEELRAVQRRVVAELQVIAGRLQAIERSVEGVARGAEQALREARQTARAR